MSEYLRELIQSCFQYFRPEIDLDIIEQHHLPAWPAGQQCFFASNNSKISELANRGRDSRCFLKKIRILLPNGHRMRYTFCKQGSWTQILLKLRLSSIFHYISGKMTKKPEKRDSCINTIRFINTTYIPHFEDVNMLVQTKRIFRNFQ